MKAYLVGVSMSLLSVAALAGTCPDWRQNGEQRSFTSEDLYNKRTFNVTAGGSIRLSECDEVPGTGWVQEPPDLTLEFRNNAKKRMLRFKLVGEKGCDTALLVNDTEADWQYSDDDDGLNPVIRFPAAAAGTYDVWFASMDGKSCKARLELETFD